jgi:hypothetical protein
MSRGSSRSHADHGALSRRTRSTPPGHEYHRDCPASDAATLLHSPAIAHPSTTTAAIAARFGLNARSAPSPSPATTWRPRKRGPHSEREEERDDEELQAIHVPRDHVVDERIEPLEERRDGEQAGGQRDPRRRARSAIAAAYARRLARWKTVLARVVVGAGEDAEERVEPGRRVRSRARARWLAAWRRFDRSRGWRAAVGALAYQLAEALGAPGAA